MTLCFFACSKPKPALRQQVRGRAPAVAPGRAVQPELAAVLDLELEMPATGMSEHMH